MQDTSFYYMNMVAIALVIFLLTKYSSISIFENKQYKLAAIAFILIVDFIVTAATLSRVNKKAEYA